VSVVIASDLAKDVAGEPLLRGVSFRLGRRERMTLSGRNGAGKTTLLRMLAGEASVDGGALSFAKGTRVAMHDQRPPREIGVSLREYVLSGAGKLVRIEQELASLEQAMAHGAHDRATLDRYARAQGRLEHAGGYAWRDRATATVRGLGFGDGDLDRGLRTFSGGELTRASLARTLVGDPDLLLLDEPTNHLDIASLEWLEQTLSSLDAAVVLVAHDRWFLEAVGTCVLELEGGRARFFAGPWHAWREEKAARELAAGRTAAREAAERQQLERFVARFRYGTRARQAQSRIKRLEKLDRRANGRARGEARALALAFSPPPRSGRVVFELEHGRIMAGDRTLLDDAELWLERGEHVALVGPNGVGKTMLLETLAGRREPAAGKLRRGHNVVLGYLSQHGDELEALPHATVLEAAQKATGLSQGAARALLGRFLFGGQEAEKPIDALSGGERRRLSLAVLVQSRANVLLLDEPTNHLDLESREALEAALRSFAGSVLVVSHDRALLDAVGTRTIAVEDGALRSYQGGWADYMRVRDERAADQQQPRGARAGAPARSGKPRRAPDHAQRAARVERQIEAAEAALAALEDELADPAAWADPAKAEAAARRHAEARRAVEDLYAELESLTP
jgi:ATP-binding cassette, subfamily F, member 3